MTLETLGIALVAVVAVILVAGRFWPQRKPPSMVFKCGRCGTAARHNARTEEAWRNGKTRFFCASCHQQWLKTQPARARETSGRHEREASGCLGVLVPVAFVPLAMLMAWWVLD